MLSGRRPRIKYGLFMLLGYVLMAVPAPVRAQPDAHRYVDLNLPAQDARVGTALFGRQAGIQILISDADAKGRRTQAVRGHYDLNQALATLLKGTGLRPVLISEDVYTLVPVTKAERKAEKPKTAAPQIKPSPPPTQLEPTEVVVTGTRLRSANQMSASPVTTISRQDLRYQGVLNLEEALNRLPQVRADATQFTNSSDTNGRIKINLRNLGWQRTLVLLDSKRLLPVEAVDINLVPSALVKRIDVLTGGASATYGSDAVAGVVNFVLDRSFEGVAISGSYGGYQHTNDNSAIRNVISKYPAINLPDKNVFDGVRSDLTVAAGKTFAEGKGNISGFIGHRTQATVTWSDRDYSACRIAVVDGQMDCVLNTINSPYGHYVVNSGERAGTTWYGAQDGSATFTPGSASANYAYNTRETFAFQRPDQRLSSGLFAHYRVSDALELYGTWLGIDDRTRSLFYPALVQQTVALNCNNPFMSAAQAQSLCGSVAGTGATVSTTIAYELNGPGSHVLDNKAINSDYRLSLGARGDLKTGWHYDLSFVGSRVYTSLSDNNEIDPVKITRALQVVDVAGTPTCLSKLDGSDPACVPANIFGYHTVDPAFYTYAYVNYKWATIVQQQVYTAGLDGDLTSYGVASPWAKTGVSVALGLEYRRDSLRNVSDEATRVYEGWLSTTAGHYGASEAYAEAQIPVISARPLAYSLDINLAYRISKYDNQSKALPTSRFDIQYRPIQTVLLRASLNNASRAPNISELYAPSYFSTNAALVDACAGTTPIASAAQCANTGVSAAQYGHISDCGTTCRTYAGGGNPLVRPEEARTLTLGFVLTPAAVPDMLVSLDYYRITVSNFIDYVDATSAFTNCLATGRNTFCQLVHRDPLTGALNGDGYVEGITQNTYRLYNSGIDIQARYSFELGNLGLGHTGRIETSALGTWLSTSAVAHTADDTQTNCAGYFGSPNCYAPQPKWRHNLRVTWKMPWREASVSVNWRYIGGTLYSGNSADPAINGGALPSTIFAKVPAYNYIDLSGAISIRRNLTLTASINNLFDLTPPVTPSTNVDGTTNNPNTWTGTYDALGRALMLRFDLKL